MSHSKTNWKHVEEMSDLGDLPNWRNTPRQMRALQITLSGLTQVKKTADGLPIATVLNGALLVKLDVVTDDETLKLVAPHACHHIMQRACAALEAVELEVVTT